MLTDAERAEVAMMIATALGGLVGNGAPSAPGGTRALPPDPQPGMMTVNTRHWIMGRDGKWRPMLEDEDKAGAAMVVTKQQEYAEPVPLPPGTR